MTWLTILVAAAWAIDASVQREKIRNLINDREERFRAERARQVAGR